MKAISEAGVRYLEPQGEPHYGAAKILSVNPPTPGFYLSIYLWIKCYILLTSVKSGFSPITRTVGQFISSVRADLPTLWKHLVCQQRAVQKVSFLLTVLHTSTVYA